MRFNPARITLLLALIPAALGAATITGPTTCDEGKAEIYTVADAPDQFTWCVGWSTGGDSDWKGNPSKTVLNWTFQAAAGRYKIWLVGPDGALASNVLQVFTNAPGGPTVPQAAVDTSGNRSEQVIKEWHSPDSPNQQFTVKTTTEVIQTIPTAVQIAPLPSLPDAQPTATVSGNGVSSNTQDTQQPSPIGQVTGVIGNPADPGDAIDTHGMIVVPPDASGVIDAATDENMVESMSTEVNPFRNRYHPPVTAKESDLSINNVVIGPHSTVFLNGEPYRVGDLIMGMDVVAITPRFIWLQKGHKILLQIPTNLQTAHLRLPEN